MLGGYVGEVMIRHHGGKWSRENEVHDGSHIVLTINQTKAFPVGKVYKRLVNGPEDNVYDYYRLITLELPRYNWGYKHLLISLEV